LPIGLTAAFVLGVVLLCGGNLSRERSAREYLSRARELASEGMVVDALECYGLAYEIKPSEELAVETARVAASGESGFRAARCMEEVLEKYPRSAAAYEYLFKLYMDAEDYPSFFSLYDKYVRRELRSAEVDKMRAEIAYSYYLIGSYDGVSDFSDGCCAVLTGEKWGYLDGRGGRILEPLYLAAEPFAGGRARVTTESGETFFIDRDGKKRVKPGRYSPRTDESVPALKTVRTGAGVYFADAQGNNVLETTWRDAREFNAQGCAFVHDGESWKLLKLYQYNH
jgi:hypothetical protein